MKQVPVRVGIVGTSWWTDSMYLPALANHPLGKVTALCGRNKDRLNERVDQWAIPFRFTDPITMMESGEINAIIIASTNDSHYDIARAAIGYGIAVLCEKPLTQSVEEANDLVKRAERAKVTTMTPFTYRWMPTNQWIKRLVDDGYIGAPRHLNMRYFTGYAREDGYAWRFDEAIAGSGLIGDLGSHWLHLARWWFGEVDAVSAYSATFGHRPHPDGAIYRQAEDSALLTVRFTNGAYGSLHISAVCVTGTPFGQTHQADLHGTYGSISSLIDWDTVQEVRGIQHGESSPMRLLPIPDDIVQGVRHDTLHNTYRDVFRNTEAMARGWVTAIANETYCYPDLAEGARVQQLVSAAQQSLNDGGRLVACPVQEIDGASAPAN